ncbi:MAG: hypothetical protein Q8936_06645 [Bacillota bacterium]|nr:hypothetical protein [Bacillota bacterium]
MSKQDLTKDQRIKKEINRLKKLFKEMPQNTMNKVISLIENAAFMTVTLEDLQNEIILKGPVCEYQNGENQWGTKKSPEVEIYNTMIKNHMSIIKQLTDLMPEPKKELPKPEDDFLKILRRDING